MAHEPIVGSRLMAGVRKDRNANGELVPSKVVSEPLHGDLPAVVVDFEDSALRDLGVVTVDGTVALSGGLGSDVYTQKIEYSGGAAIYLGYAAPGSATSAASWAIKKITYDGSNQATDIQWAGGSAAFTKIWDNRAGYSYS